MPSVYIKTYGCQMNERDSEAVAAQLVAKGYSLAASEADADVILLNKTDLADPAATRDWLAFFNAQKNVKAVAIGSTKRSALINLLRGDVLRTLAHNLRKDCHFLIVG